VNRRRRPFRSPGISQLPEQHYDTGIRRGN